MKNTIVGVDLAKDVIQVCICKNNKVHSNTEMVHRDFLTWLFNSKPMTLIFEACGTSNYWKQRAIEAGHDAHLISAKLVASIRQNQKTDKNDALAIAQASQLADIQFVKGKGVEQQQLQSMMRLRELAIKQKTASSNQIKALLLEFKGLHRFRWVTSRANRLWIQIHPTAVKVNSVAKTLPVAKSTRLSFNALNAAVHTFRMPVVTL